MIEAIEFIDGLKNPSLFHLNKYYFNYPFLTENI